MKYCISNPCGIDLYSSILQVYLVKGREFKLVPSTRIKFWCRCQGLQNPCAILYLFFLDLARSNLLILFLLHVQEWKKIERHFRLH